LDYKNEKLVGVRRWVTEYGYKESISLSRRGKNPLSMLECVDKSRPCSFAIQSGVPAEVVVVGDSAQISVELMDTDVNDSDLVTIFFGKSKMLDKVPIFTDAIYSLPMRVTQDTLITWCACNTGLNGLNTGRIRIVEYSDSKFETETIIPVKLEANKQATILIHKRKGKDDNISVR